MASARARNQRNKIRQKEMVPIVCLALTLDSLVVDLSFLYDIIGKRRE